MKRFFTIILGAFVSFGFVTSYEIANQALEAATAEEMEIADENAPASTLFVSEFTDVKEGNYHYIPIIDLAMKGTIKGYSDGSFEPYEPINRAEALKIILETFSEQDIESFDDEGKRPFQDVPLNIWHSQYITAAKQLEMISGYDDETFRPWEPINLAEALKLIMKAMPNYYPVPATEDPFADVAVDAWYADYVNYAKSREMVHIPDSNKIRPEQIMTRGYFAEIIYRLKKFGEGYNFGRATFYGAALHGNTTASGKVFDMYKMTAAHKELPFGTIIEVTNIANGKTVQVEITDRGPYGHGRVIDLSSGAFEVIASLGTGVLTVQYDIISQPE